MKRIRAWQVKPGDVLISPGVDWDAWRYVRARPVMGDELQAVVRNRRRFIAPNFDFEVVSEPRRGARGTSSGWGPLDWVMIRDRADAQAS